MEYTCPSLAPFLYKYLAPGLLLFVDKLLCSETVNLLHTIVGTLFGPMESHP